MDYCAPPVSFENNNKDKNEEYITRISIDTQKLQQIEKKNLIELIQMIKYICYLSLNDYRYIEKTYGIFRIVNGTSATEDLLTSNYSAKHLASRLFFVTFKLLELVVLY